MAAKAWTSATIAAVTPSIYIRAVTNTERSAGRHQPDDPKPGWWDPMIGPGRGIDTDRWFVVCTNVLGGCQGTTGPATPHPDDGRPYGSRFPVVTIRDMVRAQAQLGQYLGIVFLGDQIPDYISFGRG